MRRNTEDALKIVQEIMDRKDSLKIVKGLLQREDAKYEHLLKNEHPDQQEKSTLLFQEGVVAGLLTAVELLGRSSQKCCPEPEVRGGRCTNCGTWLADGDEDWNSKVVHCLEMIVKLLRDNKPRTSMLQSDYANRVADIEDFIVNHLGKD